MNIPVTVYEAAPGWIGVGSTGYEFEDCYITNVGGQMYLVSVVNNE